MKNHNSFLPSLSKALIVLGLFFFGSTVQLSAQDATFEYEGQYHDYVIPQTTKSYLALTAVGGDGGRIQFKNLLTDFKVSAGRGAYLQAYFSIGDQADELKPGSTLRFIVGGKGESRLTAGSTGAGGGGGTGIAYQEAGTDTWTLLMVAGGGGGAAHDLINGKISGKASPAYSKGEEGDGTGGETYDTVGGGGGAYEGDSKFKPGSGANSSTLQYDYGTHAEAGWSGGPDAGEPTGGSCVSTGPQGGFGFGAGGDGDTAGAYPGGGGGYSGGDAGDPDRVSATGGTSYLNTSMQTSSVTAYEQGTTTSPSNGYASLEFTDSFLDHSIRFAFNPNKCIDDYGSNTSNGTNIQTYTCHGDYNQQWFFSSTDRTIRTMLNTNKCLSLKDDTGNNGTNIHLWDCKVNDNQRFVYNGLYKTIHSARNAFKCIDATNGSAYPNANVNLQLWDCEYSNNNQKWDIDGGTTVSNVSYMKHIIPAFHTGYAVHSHTGAESSSNIQLWTKDDTNTAEQWYFDGLAIKMRDYQNLCIDLKSSSTSNGNNIQLYNCNGTNAQQWLYDGMTRTIRSVINQGKCIQIEKNADGVYGKRSNVEIHDCNGSDVQQFLIQE